MHSAYTCSANSAYLRHQLQRSSLCTPPISRLGLVSHTPKGHQRIQRRRTCRACSTNAAGGLPGKRSCTCPSAWPQASKLSTKLAWCIGTSSLATSSSTRLERASFQTSALPTMWTTSTPVAPAPPQEASTSSASSGRYSTWRRKYSSTSSTRRCATHGRQPLPLESVACCHLSKAANFKRFGASLQQPLYSL